MTTNFFVAITTKNGSKNNLKKSKLSKRTLGMESLESREMLSVNPLGIDINYNYNSPDFVQTNATQDFQTETAGDIVSFTATTDNNTAVTFAATIAADTTAETEYSLYYTICEDNSFVGTGTWTLIASSTKESTGSGADGAVDFTSVTFDATTLADANSGKYVFFGVAAGNANTINGSSTAFASTGTNRIADVTHFVQLASSGAPAPTPATVATTNSTSSESGVTSSAVTLTWTKPTKAEDATGTLVDIKVPTYNKNTGNTTDYRITLYDSVNPPKVYYSAGKTTYTITDLDPEEAYSYTVESILTAKTVGGQAPKADTNGYVVVTLGSFSTETITLADEMAVGRPTDVKTTPTDTSVKITWKAPVNYTGSYNVTIKNLKSGGDEGTFTVAAGAKTEATILYGTEALSDGDNDLTHWKLTKSDRYEVVILPISGNEDGTNGLASTPTNFIAQKTQTDQTPTVTATQPDVPLDTLFIITPGVGKIVVTKTAENVPDGVDGYYIVVAANVTSSAVADATYVTKAQFEATSGVTIGNLAAGSYKVKIFAANSVGESTTGLVLDNSSSSYTVDAPLTTVANGPDSAKNVTATKDTTVANKVKVTWENNDEKISDGDGNNGEDGYAAKSYDVYYSIKDQNQWVFAGNVSATTLELTVENLLYAKDYDFAVVANCNVEANNAPKVAVLKKAASSVTIGAAPTVTVDAKNILTAKKVSEVKYENGDVKFTLDAFVPAKGKTNPDQYYVVLRDANKAVIAHTLLSGTTTGNVTLDLDDIVLTPKAKYTVEVFGVVGSDAATKVSTAKASVSISVADYPAATLKVDGKATINEANIIITDKTVDADKFYYVQYTSVADAKSKPDWSTATVEAVTASAAGVKYQLHTKLNPNTQYYVRIVTSDVNVGINANIGNSDDAWNPGTGGGVGLDDWLDATKVVFGKEIKIKTAAVPLATVGKPAFALNDDFNMTLKTVGQTMLSAKGADALFSTTENTKPLYNATFAYSLLVSLDSKVDKVTGKLLGSAEINLGDGTSLTNGIVTELYTPKTGSAVPNGQYTLEYDLTGSDGILSKLEITPANASSLKNLNFQLVTTVTYSGVSFDSVTKPGKVAMPKWFV